MRRLLALLALFGLVACADSLERLSNEVYSGAGSNQSFDERTTPAVRAYYLQKYGASGLQKMKALEAGSRFTKARSERPAGEARKPPMRFAAVDVPKTSVTKGASQVMIFDTLSNTVVGNDVYDLVERPSPNEKLIFDTMTVEYVGSGR